jgi:predicted esterase
MIGRVWWALVALAAVGAAAELRLALTGCEQEVLVSLPEDHDGAGKWPAIFHYHGMNGRPDTAVVRAHAGPRGWIVVGMAYVQEGQYSITVESLQRELAVLRQVRDRLAAEHGLDPQRVYVCGVSKGGWMVDHLLQAERTLAGGAILLAGHISELPAPPVLLRGGTPVFIGIGRRDANFTFALRALQFHRARGATVHIETWDDLAHSLPRDGSPGLREWFAIQAGGECDGAALERELTEIAGLPPVDRWWRLTCFKERPAVARSGSPWMKRADVALAAIAADPAVVREQRIYQEHRRLLAREIGSRSVPKLEAVMQAYIELGAKAEGTNQAQFVEIDLRRVQDVLKRVQGRQPREAGPSGRRDFAPPEVPDDRRTIPRNPLVR